MTRHTLFTYIGILAIVLLVIGLLGWYFFLRGQGSNIAALDAARGFSIAVPSFTGSRSSTSENIAQGSNELTLTAPESGKPPRLWRASLAPVAGAGFVGTTTLRYMERSTGHIYDVDITTGNAARLTNMLLPKVYDAGILGDGTIVFRMLNELGESVTLTGVLGTTTDDGFLRFDTENLGTGVLSVAYSARPEMVLVAASSQGAEVVRAENDEAPERLLSLALRGLEPLLLNDGRVFLTERPASGLPGSSFEIVSGALQPLMRAVPGLSILPRASSAAFLYSSDDAARVRLFLRPSADAATLELPLETTAKKCVWGARASTSTATVYCAASQTPLPAGYTDLYMRGSAHTLDAWFTIDTASGKVEKLFTPETSVALDVEHPMIDAEGKYITFMNARDKSLWVLRIDD
jgi:hypothetical protein